MEITTQEAYYENESEPDFDFIDAHDYCLQPDYYIRIGILLSIAGPRADVEAVVAAMQEDAACPPLEVSYNEEGEALVVQDSGFDGMYPFWKDDEGEALSSPDSIDTVESLLAHAEGKNVDINGVILYSPDYDDLIIKVEHNTITAAVAVENTNEDYEFDCPAWYDINIGGSSMYVYMLND